MVVPKPWWSWAMGSREPHAGRCCRVSPHPCHLSPAVLAAPTRVQAQLCSLLGLAAVALGNLCPPAKHPGDFGSLLGQLRPHCPHSWGRAGTGLGAADTAGSGAEPPPCVALRLHFPGPPPHFAPQNPQGRGDVRSQKSSRRVPGPHLSGTGPSLPGQGGRISLSRSG